MDDIYHPNYPNPPLSVLRGEAEAEARADEARAWAVRVKRAADAWSALKNDLAALVDQSHPCGTRGRGYHLANLEDADLHVLSILEDV